MGGASGAGLQWNNLLKFELGKFLHCSLHSFHFLVTSLLFPLESYCSHTALWTWPVFIWGHFSSSNVPSCKIALLPGSTHTFFDHTHILYVCITHVCTNICTYQQFSVDLYRKYGLLFSVGVCVRHRVLRRALHLAVITLKPDLYEF